MLLGVVLLLVLVWFVTRILLFVCCALLSLVNSSWILLWSEQIFKKKHTHCFCYWGFFLECWVVILSVIQRGWFSNDVTVCQCVHFAARRFRLKTVEAATTTTNSHSSSHHTSRRFLLFISNSMASSRITSALAPLVRRSVVASRHASAIQRGGGSTPPMPPFARIPPPKEPVRYCLSCCILLVFVWVLVATDCCGWYGGSFMIYTFIYSIKKKTWHLTSCFRFSLPPSIQHILSHNINYYYVRIVGGRQRCHLGWRCRSRIGPRFWHAPHVVPRSRGNVVVGIWILCPLLSISKVGTRSR